MVRASAKSEPLRPSASSDRPEKGQVDAGKPLDAPFRIAADGAWYHLDRVIERPEMVRLFARSLRREAAGYALVTPYERHAVIVEDAPFIAVAMASEGAGRGRRLTFTTNLGAEVVAGRDHPLVVCTGAQGDPRPYVALGDGLEARLSRAVYYELASAAESDAADALGVWSDGVFFSLEPVPRP